VIEEGKDNQVTLTFPSGEGDYAFVVDGQHRLFSFRDEYRKLANGDTFEIPVVALHNATDEQVGETFVQINVNQKPVNRDLLIQMKAILGLLDTDIDKASIDLIHALDDDPESPLNGKILRYPKEQNKWIKVGQLVPIIKALLVPGGVLYEKNHAERKRILNEYFTAVKETFPSAWADEKSKDYALLTATGLQMILGVLPDTMSRCDFNEGFSYTSETFARQLEPLQALAILGDWGKSSVQEPFGVRPRREMFLGQLKEALRLRPPGA
jgi:DGQHR domain-containing protein